MDDDNEEDEDEPPWLGKSGCLCEAPGDLLAIMSGALGKGLKLLDDEWRLSESGFLTTEVLDKEGVVDDEDDSCFVE